MEDNIKKVGNAMDNIAKLNEKGITVQGGKKYTQVVTRVEAFRREFGFSYGIDTDILFPADGGAVVKAKVLSDQGHLIGSGMAYTSNISKEKCLEKLETTAVGRALASCGLAGGEYASDDEIKSYEERYERREFSFTKEDHDKILDRIADCGDRGSFENIKADARAEWGNMKPHHKAKIKSCIAEKEQDFIDEETNQQFQNSVGG
jgi:hypothetical protein